MHYVISDIHGCCREFQSLLEIIHFSDADILYVLGDVVDRGPDSVGVLKLMSLHDNIIPILGNHDYMFENVVPGLFTEITEDSIDSVLTGDFLGAYDAYQRNGGESTLREFKGLDPEDREFYMDYMGDFSLYETLNLNGKCYLLIHSLPDGYPGGGAGENGGRDPYLCRKADTDACRKADTDHLLSDVSSFTLEECIFGRPDFFGEWNQETILITGHTPTVKLGPDHAGKIYHKGNFYDIDCGCVTGHRLGALCLETGKEYYTDSLKQYWTGKKQVLKRKTDT